MSNAAAAILVIFGIVVLAIAASFLIWLIGKATGAPRYNRVSERWPDRMQAEHGDVVRAPGRRP